MKYRILAIICLITFILGVFFRFFYVNKTMRKYDSKKKNYNIGDEVPFERDFFFSNSEMCDGYSITVLDTCYLTVDEFKKQYNVADESVLEFAEYVYMLKVNFKNNSDINSEKTGISMNRLILQETSFISYPDNNAFMLLNNLNHTGFSLPSKYEKEFLIPFGINDSYIDIDELIKGDTKLVITLYPNKKMINLNS